MNKNIICPHCGNQLSIEASVMQCRCGVCGNVINVMPGEEPQISSTVGLSTPVQPYGAMPPSQSTPQSMGGPAPYQQPYAASPAPQKSGSSNILLIIIIALLALIIGAGVAYFLINKDKDTETAPSQPMVIHDTIRETQTVAQQVPTTVPQAPVAAPVSPTRANAVGRGLYPFASTRRLSASELSDYSARQLKIMRNEIYARHGYIFQTADMRSYFAAQSWYTPVSHKVTLSSIEQANVATIQRVEAMK